jgi:hypothetical protein
MFYYTSNMQITTQQQATQAKQITQAVNLLQQAVPHAHTANTANNAQVNALVYAALLALYEVGLDWDTLHAQQLA